ncbi:hypothetical protein STEG23_012796, partial [Scotinomys teguina]
NIIVIVTVAMFVSSSGNQRPGILNRTTSLAESKAKERTELGRVKNVVQNRCKFPSALTPPSDSVQVGKGCQDD